MTHQENLSACGNCHKPVEGAGYGVGWLDAEGKWHGKMTVCERCAPAAAAQQSVEMSLEQMRLRCSFFGQKPVIGNVCPNA